MALPFCSAARRRLTQVDQRLHDRILGLDRLRTGLIVPLLRDHIYELRGQVDVRLFDRGRLQHTLRP